MAAKHGNIQCARALIAAGAHVVDTNMEQLSALHAAILSNYVAVVQLLLEHGATAMINSIISGACDNGEHCCDSVTALMLCEHPAIAEVLLAAGADVHVATDAGDIGLHVAARHNYAAPVLFLLIKAGADLHAVNSSGKTAAQLAYDGGHTLIEQLLLRVALQER
eukprot:15199-Heterococcus_DN1.PRE.3